MFESEGTAADGIGLFFSLFVSGSEGQAIDEVHGRRSLSISHDLALELGRVILSDDVDVLLKDVGRRAGRVSRDCAVDKRREERD